MPACPQCSRPLQATDDNCPGCGIVLAKYHGGARRSDHQTLPAPEPTPSGAFAGKLKALAVFIVLVVLFVSLIRPDRLPPIALTPANPAAAEDPCAGTPRCLVIYVAPWCSACHGAKPVIEAMRSRLLASGKVGVRLIVGMDEQAALAAYASAYEGPSFLDVDGRFSRVASVDSVPSFLVLDRTGKVLARQSGAYDDADHQLEMLHLDAQRLSGLH